MPVENPGQMPDRDSALGGRICQFPALLFELSFYESIHKFTGHVAEASIIPQRISGKQKLIMSEHFSERLAEALKKSGKSQTEVSALAGITPPYLSDLKKGKKSNPSNDIVSALAKALGVSVGWLLANESKDTPSNSYVLREEPPIYGAKTTAHEWEAMFKKILDDSDLDWLLDRLDQLVDEAVTGDVNAARAVRMIIPRVRARIAAINR